MEQVLALRKAVLHNIRPKAINGQLVTGTEWIALVEAYVEAINTGAVPNIQSAWTYIQRQAAERAVEAAKSNFEREL